MILFPRETSFYVYADSLQANGWCFLLIGDWWNKKKTGRKNNWIPLSGLSTTVSICDLYKIFLTAPKCWESLNWEWQTKGCNTKRFITCPDFTSCFFFLSICLVNLLVLHLFKSLGYMCIPIYIQHTSGV